MREPFKLKEIHHIEEGWKPKLKQEYLIQYRFTVDKNSAFLMGYFTPQWYGFCFHWFWGANSLQLSTQSFSKDIENFVGVWEVTRFPEPEFIGKQKTLITKEEMDI